MDRRPGFTGNGSSTDAVGREKVLAILSCVMAFILVTPALAISGIAWVNLMLVIGLMAYVRIGSRPHAVRHAVPQPQTSVKQAADMSRSRRDAVQRISTVLEVVDCDAVIAACYKLRRSIERMDYTPDDREVRNEVMVILERSLPGIADAYMGARRVAAAKDVSDMDVGFVSAISRLDERLRDLDGRHAENLKADFTTMGEYLKHRHPVDGDDPLSTAKPQMN